MKLIGDIINELMDADKQISGALLKTKVLASRIDNDALFDWVDSELNGYTNKSLLPSYRISSGTLYGTFANGNLQYSNSLIPTFGLTDSEYQKITEIKIFDSVSSIEKIQQGKSSVISVSSAEKEYIEYTVRNAGNRFFQILSVHLTMPSTLFSNIVASVRSKLLDFMLAIEKQFGQETEIKDLKEKSNLVTQIMHTTIHTSGDGNIINTGNDNTITSENTINKGNKDFLAQTLKDKGVQDEDVQELLAIVDLDVVPEPNTYNQQVSNWMKKMINKSIDGTWQVGVGAAGGIIGDALATHYGWK